MIEGINNSDFNAKPLRERMNFKMTDEQKETFAEIISNFNPNNMTADDKKELMSMLKDAGIKPGDDLKNLLKEAGFEITPPPDRVHDGRHQNVGGKSNGELPDSVSRFVDKFKSGTATEADLNELVNWIQSNNLDFRGILVDENS